ncbi:MAG TPA: pilus assembly protein N-terminal domain-containing protein, partial [Gemmataceae bacterium]|nr:pilus assembly protein N-terminal domain-containing protein [Gemmataceae bacterium]
MAARGALLRRIEEERTSWRDLPIAGRSARFIGRFLAGGLASALFAVAAAACAQAAPPAGPGASVPLLRPADLAPTEPAAPSLIAPLTAPALAAPLAVPSSAAPLVIPTPPANDLFPPSPRPAPGSRLAALPSAPAPLGTTPEPNPQVREKLGQYVDKFVDPEATLDLIIGRTRLLVLRNTPKRIQVAAENAVDYNLISANELLLMGKRIGNTSLTLWFPDPKDKDKVVTLTYLVRVYPDPEEKDRLDRVYKALESEVNHFFPESHIELSMLGDKL